MTTRAPAAQRADVADGATIVDDPPVPEETPSHGRWSRLGTHVLIYGVLLVALLAGSRLNASWSADDGAYATQVNLARTGDWAYPYAHTDIDPTGRNVPLGNSEFDPTGRTFPYVKQPVWILVLQASSRLFGRVVGLYVPGALGALAAAVVGWKLAERLGGRGPVGFWAVGLSPLLAHATAMWAHTTSAAIAGLVTLGIVAVVQRRDRWWHAAGLSAGLAVLCLLRAEGLLFSVAVVVVLAFLAWQRAGSWRDRIVALVTLAGLPAVAAVVAVKANDVLSFRLSHTTGPWRASPLDGIPTTFIEAREFGFMRTFVLGPGAASLSLLVVIGLALIVVAGRSWRRTPDDVGRPLFLGLTGVALLLPRFIAGAQDLVGLLPAAPLLIFGLPLVRRRGDRDPVGPLLGVGALYLGAVIATQYAAGGGREWGGRYTFLAIVPLLVIAALAVDRQVTRWVPVANRRTVLAAFGLALVAVPALFGVIDTWQLREARFRASEEMGHATTPIVIALDAPLPRLGWRYLPGPDWLYSRREDLPRLLAALRAQHAGPVTLVGGGADAITAAGYDHDVKTPTMTVLTPVS